jgi:hypothetical protein
MKKPKSNEVSTEIECPACEGTDFRQTRSRHSPVEKYILHPASNVLAKDACLNNCLFIKEATADVLTRTLSTGLQHRINSSRATGR